MLNTGVYTQAGIKGLISPKLSCIVYLKGTGQQMWRVPNWCKIMLLICNRATVQFITRHMLYLHNYIFMAALWNRAGHYIFAVWFLLSSSFFFFFFFLDYSQRSQIGCLPYFHTWCGLSANLRCRSETCCTRLAENTGRKNRQKFAIWAPSPNFVGLYLRN